MSISQTIFTKTARRLYDSSQVWFGPLDILAACWKMSGITITFDGKGFAAISDLPKLTRCLEQISGAPVSRAAVQGAVTAGMRQAFGSVGGSLVVCRTGSEVVVTVTPRPTLREMYAALREAIADRPMCPECETPLIAGRDTRDGVEIELWFCDDCGYEHLPAVA